MTLESTSARAVLSSLLPTARFVRIGIRIGPYVVSQIVALLVWILTPVFNAIFGFLGALFIVLISSALLGGATGDRIPKRPRDSPSGYAGCCYHRRVAQPSRLLRSRLGGCPCRATGPLPTAGSTSPDMARRHTTIWPSAPLPTRWRFSFRTCNRGCGYWTVAVVRARSPWD